MRIFFITLLFVALSSSLCSVTSFAAGRPKTLPKVEAGQVTLDFKDIKLVDLVQTMSELTGRNFVYQERELKGTVTVASPKPMTLDEAYEVFNTVLSVKGFTIVPSGKVNKIVATKRAATDILPKISRNLISEQFVTRVVRVKNVEATTLVNNVLKPLLPKTSHIAAYAPTNTLIITDNAANISRLVQIIKELDQPGSGTQMEIFQLRFASADEVATLGSKLLSGKAATTPTRGRAAAAGRGAFKAKVLPYPRTNTLVMVGNPDDLAMIRELIVELDRKPAQERSKLNVYYLENADSETMAKTLNEILTGIKQQARGNKNISAKQKQAALSEGVVTITADKPTNSLIINASPEDYEVLQNIIARLDIKRKQVYVEALILELSMDATRNLGVSLQGALAVNGNGVTIGTSNLNSGRANFSDFTPAGDSGIPSLLGKTINGLLLGGMFNPITVTGPDGNDITVPAFSALIDLSEDSSDINILSAPRLLTSDNEEAQIIVGKNVPVITNRLTDTGSSGLATNVAVERQDVALTLRFTPQVTEGNLVRLNVFQEITDIAPASPAIGDPTEVGPTFTKRNIQNTVLAEDGKTVVLGGLIGTNIQEKNSKVPLLGDLPLLGWLFRSEGTSETKTNLLVFITPKIIRNSQDLAEITERSRMTSQGFRTEELRQAVPAGTFDFNTGIEPATKPEAADRP